jgi:hypothetical protein
MSAALWLMSHNLRFLRVQQMSLFLHLSYSCATPFGPALLVTQDPIRTFALN